MSFYVELDTNGQLDTEIGINFENELRDLLHAYTTPIIHSRNTQKCHARDKANCFEECSMSYMNPLMTKGYKQILEIEDLTSPPHNLHLNHIYPGFIKHCISSQSNVAQNEFNFTFNVFQTLLNINKGHFVKSSICVICDILLQILYVFIFRELIRFLYDENASIYYGIAYAILIAITMQSASLFIARSYVHSETAAIATRNLLMGLIFRKSLLIPNYRLSNSDTSVGEIVNIMGNDTMRIYVMIAKGMVVFPSILCILICLAVMIWIIGFESLIGFAIISSLVPLSIFIGKKLGKMKRIALKFTDERVKFLSEILNGMKIIKFYAYEKPLREVIHKIRENELKQFKSIFNWRAVLVSIVDNISYVTIVAILFVKTLLNEPINVIEVYLVIVFVGTLTYSLKRLSRINFLINGMVSVHRIQKFFDINDQKQQIKPLFCDEHKSADNIVIQVKNGHFYHKPQSFDDFAANMLKDVNVKIYRNELVAIIGAVASGKSMLIQSILGETYCNTKDGFVRDTKTLKTGYVGQTNFIINGTIRENIIMNLEFDMRNYNKCVTAAALMEDFKLFPTGDQTEIGSKGVTVSGGQKTRICIARAFYLCLQQNIELLLFDDPLSNVDIDVAQRIFYEGILKLCRNTTVIVVLSSHLQFLDRFDRIIVMEYVKNGNENGFCKIAENCHCSANEGNLNKLKQKYETLLTQLIEKQTRKRGNNKIRKQTDYTYENETDIQMMQQNKLKNLGKDEFNLRSKLIVSEDRVRGNLNRNSLLQYFTASFPRHGQLLCVTLTAFYIVTQSIWIFFDLFLSWFGAKNSLWPLSNQINHISDNGWIIILAGFAVSVLLLAIIRSILLYRICLASSKTFEHSIFSRIMHAPMSYFNATPMGRITNRFSRDLTIIDSEVPIAFDLVSQKLAQFIGILVLLCIFIPWYILVLLPIIICAYKLRKIYVASSRELQRMEGITRSPIVNVFNECIFGLATIRAHKLEQYFITKLETQIHTNTQCFFDNAMMNRWFSVLSEFLVIIQILSVALFVILWKDSMTPNIGALCITLTVSFCGGFQYFIRTTADLETQLTAVERLHSFEEIAQESSHDSNESFKRKHKWPNHGEIHINNLRLRYRKDLPLILDGINCNIAGGAKIGICGRSGAGKSSLMIALFRMFEAEHGSVIKIDGIDILKDVGLFDLRSNLCIIPQEPILFSGTLRFNLDPFHRYSDNDIIAALKNVYLWDFFSKQSEIENIGLNYEISMNGSNLSFGQTQLICIARALLKRPTVLVLDEATSSIDFEHDQLIQQSIRENFSENCTILTIAHRLETIIDSDQILVLDKGKIVEFGEPQKLMLNTNGHFYKLWQSSKH